MQGARKRKALKGGKRERQPNWFRMLGPEKQQRLGILCPQTPKGWSRPTVSWPTTSQQKEALEGPFSSWIKWESFWEHHASWMHWYGELVGCLANTTWLRKALSFPTMQDTPSKARGGLQVWLGDQPGKPLGPHGPENHLLGTETLNQSGLSCQGTIHKLISPQKCPTWEVLTNLIREDPTAKSAELGKLLHPCTWDSLLQQETPELLKTWKR